MLSDVEQMRHRGWCFAVKREIVTSSWRGFRWTSKLLGIRKG